MTKEELKKEIERLEDSKTGCFAKDMDIMGQIHALNMKLEGVKSINEECPIDGSCENCGS